MLYGVRFSYNACVTDTRQTDNASYQQLDLNARPEMCPEVAAAALAPIAISKKRKKKNDCKAEASFSKPYLTFV